SLRDEASGDSCHCEVAVDAVGGHPGHRLWRLRNVSAQHQTESTIREERDELSGLLDNVPVGIYSIDGSGRFRYVNQTFAQWLGTTPSEMLGSAARLLDFTASGPAAREPIVLSPGATREEIVLKSAEGRMIP